MIELEGNNVGKRGWEYLSEEVSKQLNSDTKESAPDKNLLDWIENMGSENIFHIQRILFIEERKDNVQSKINSIPNIYVGNPYVKNRVERAKQELKGKGYPNLKEELKVARSKKSKR